MGLTGLVLWAVLAVPLRAEALHLITALPQNDAARGAVEDAGGRIRQSTGLPFTVAQRSSSLEVLEAIHRGEADLVLVPAQSLEPIAKDFHLFRGLFLFGGLDEAFEFLRLAEDHLLVRALQESPLTGLAWWGGEMRHLAGKRAVKLPGDLAGRRLATADERFQRLRAQPVRLPAGEIAQALRMGQVDLAECSLAAAENQADVMPVVSLTHHRFQGWVLVAQRSRWQSLDAVVAGKIRAILQEAGRALAVRQVEEERHLLARLRNDPRRTPIFLEPKDLRAWRQAAAELNEAVAQRSGPDYRSLLRDGFVLRKEATASAPGPAAAPPPPSLPAPAPPAIPAPPAPPPEATVPSAPVTARQPLEIYWNGWCETLGRQDVAQLEVGKRYRFSVDVSRFIYRASLGSPAAGEIFDLLRREGQVSLLLQPLLVGGHLEAPPDAPLKAQLLTIDRHRLQPAPNEAEVLAAFAAGEITTGELARAVNLGPVVSWDLVAREAGCGTVTLSVWDSAGTQPLDHLIFSLPIAAAAGAAAPACERTTGKRIQSGLLALLVDPAAPAADSQSLVDAALHIYETRGPERTYSMAVFVNRDRLVAARDDLAQDDPGIYAWQLQTALSEYVSGPGQMLKAVGQAHQTLRNYPSEPYPFAEVGQELAAKIFSGANSQGDAIARQALSSFQRLLASRENPTCLVQLISAGGEMIYLPMGLLAARAAEPVAPRRFQVVQPLAYAAPQPQPACFDRWALAIPQDLAGVGSAATRLMNLDRSPAPWMTEWVDTHAELRQFFQGQAAVEPAVGPGLGLILLAHHEGGYLWFNHRENPRRILLNDIRRPFPPGSVALVVACSASGAAPESRAIVQQLNRLGVGAMIISSLPVDAEFGTYLALEFLTEIRQLHESQRSAHLGEILRNALQRTAACFPANPQGFGEMALEFQVVGQYELALCPRP